ncbi:MAG: phage holin family protein [Verrucomicrobia bacterium]|nr:phage holin family protein [Verrucomicrobiota bacterium]
MGETAPPPGGWLASLRRLGDSLLALAQSRLQLLALELQSEQLRLVNTLLWLGLGLALGGVGLLFGAAALALYLWEIARFAGLLVMMVVLVGAAAVILWRLRERLRKGPQPFAETIAEFKKDRACLRGKD